MKIPFYMMLNVEVATVFRYTELLMTSLLTY